MLQASIDGLMIGVFYALVALGLTLIFGVLRIFNFAHGEFYMLGGFAAYYFLRQLGLNFFLTLMIGVVAVGILGIVIERLVFRPFRTEPMNGFIASLGLIWILQTMATMVFGVLDKNVPSVFQGVIRILGTSLSVESLSVAAIGIAMIVGVYLFLHRTKSGKALRAVAQDREAASLQGISVDRISAMAFGLGAGIAAGAGVLMGPIFFISPYVGGPVVVKTFIIIILGGMGSIPGAVLGGLLLGFIESFAALKLSAGGISALTFAMVMIILLIRPGGLLGRA